MIRPHFRLALAPLLVTLTATTLAPAWAAETTARDMWYGIYMNTRKVGYAYIREEPAVYHAQPVIKLTSKSVITLTMMGAKLEQRTDSTILSDSSFRPMHQEVKITSAGSALNLIAEYGKDKIDCTVDSGGGPSHRAVPIPAGANLAGDDSTVTRGQTMAVGTKTSCYYLNPLSLALERSDVEVLSQGQVKLGGTSHQAFQVATTSSIGKMITWQTSTGEALYCTMPLGMSMYRLTKDQAVAANAPQPTFLVAGMSSPATPAYTPPADFAIATAIQTDQAIKNPRTAKELTLLVNGVDNKSLVISDARQNAAAADGQANAYRISVHAAPFDAAKAAALPMSAPELKPFLAKAPYLETDDAEIAALAVKLKGSESNAYTVAERIREWVYKNMTPDAGIGVPRSCIDVLHRRRGVCRDYATLYAGIARAAGVPTRVVSGIVYADGRFFYHAWAESYVGQWVPFDPTMAGSFVDATHIKFAQGDVTDMYNVGGIIGRIKVNVVAVQ